MSVLDIGLAIEGLPEATIRELDAELPTLERLVANFEQAEPLNTKIWTDIVAVTPLIRQLIAFAKQKQGT